MRKERGAITIVTLTTVLFMLAFLISTFTIVANRRQAQAEIKKQTEQLYGSDIESVEQEYNSYFADSSKTIPIYTETQLFRVASGELIFADGKIYKCTADADYKLMNNIKFTYNEEYKSKYPDVFNADTSWINIEELKTNGLLTGNFDYNGKTIIETKNTGETLYHQETANN